MAAYASSTGVNSYFAIEWVASPASVMLKVCDETVEGCSEGYGAFSNVAASSFFAGGYSLPAGKGLTVDSAGVVTLTDYELALTEVVGLADAITAANPGTGSGFLPDLTLEQGGLIATAIIALWSLGFIFRAIRKMIEES
jgi:hypothetical protein